MPRSGILIGGLFAVTALLLVGVFFIGPQPAERAVPSDPVAKATPERPTPETPMTSSIEDPAPTPTPADDEAISAIISDPNLDHPQIVGKLVQMIPSLSEEEQANAAQHVANLSDDVVTAVWIPKILDRSMPDAAAGVLIADLYNRSHDILLPVLASLADDPRSPFAEESAETLEVLIGPREGNVTWTTNLRNWRATQPAETP